MLFAVLAIGIAGVAIVYARELLLPLVEPSLHLQPLRFELQHTVNSRH
jgi:hypothetical protein